MIWLAVLVATIICAILYRAGGEGKGPTDEPTWMPMVLRESWVRDWLIPLIIYPLMLFKPMDWLGYLMFIPAIGLTGGALSTYWDNLFGFDNYWFAGFLVGIAAFPLYWSGVHWYLIIARALLLAVLWGGWSAAIKKDTWEEYGRGGFTALTMALLLL